MAVIKDQKLKNSLLFCLAHKEKTSYKSNKMSKPQIPGHVLFTFTVPTDLTDYLKCSV